MLRSQEKTNKLKIHSSFISLETLFQAYGFNYKKMATYLIEIPHSENTFECRQVVKLFVESGSHLLINAYWGCKSGVHKSWFIADFSSKEEALQVVPPFLRHTAHIIELIKFTKADIVEFAKASTVLHC